MVDFFMHKHYVITHVYLQTRKSQVIFNQVNLILNLNQIDYYNDDFLLLFIFLIEFRLEFLVKSRDKQQSSSIFSARKELANNPSEICRCEIAVESRKRYPSQRIKLPTTRDLQSTLLQVRNYRGYDCHVTLVKYVMTCLLTRRNVLIQIDLRA